MKYSKRSVLRFFLVVTLIIPGLTACGGGSSAPQSSTQNTINTGGVTPDDCVTVPGTPDTCSNPPSNNTGGSGAAGNATNIDRNNAAEVTNAVLTVIDIFYDLGERQGVGGDIVTASRSDTAGDTFSLADLALGQLTYLAELDSLSLLDTSMVVGIHGPTLVPCASGTVTNLSADPAVINARFDDCVLNGVTLSGDLTIDQFNVEPNANVVPPWELSALFTFTGGLTIDDGVRPVTVNSGAMRFSASADSSANGTGLIRVESPLGLSYQSGETVTVQNQFTLDYSFNVNTSATTINVNGGITRSGGSTSALTVATRTVLNRFSGSTLGTLPPGPYDSGRLRIMSSDTSNVTLEVINSTDVFLDINDGTDSINMTWADLLNS
ncbi:MAG TPA: hypothetical protein ENJ22_05995 [Gammaproteobacteria bacterium]|nr:hypothetical protein [Gammaproteobacteria bacterium]